MEGIGAMNLTNFLKKTDEITAQCSREQLTVFIHEIGRILPEHQRENFLARLRATGEGAGKKAVEEEALVSFQEMYRQVRDDLKKIDSQEITISGTLNEEYDDWYDESGDEFYYQDENGISDMLLRACDFVHVCLDREEYKKGFEIGRQLFSMEILCISDYEDEELTIEDMADYDLLDCDLKRTALDTAYCAYCAVPPNRRTEVLYEISKNVPKDAVTLEALMQHGDEELCNFEDFLPLWIAYLGDKTGYDADRLILEAVGLLNDVTSAAGYAARFADVHPALYRGILENGESADANEMASLGMEAIKNIPKKYTMRSWAALKTAEYLEQTGQKSSLVQKCCFSAYESDTSACSYLRALFHGYGTEEKRGSLRKVFMELPASKSSGFHGAYENDGSGSERQINMPDGNMILTLRFLDGQFADVLKEGLNKSQALGEVQESLGNPCAKQKLMTSYKDKYSRRSAFRAELISCGWIDVRKKRS